MRHIWSLGEITRCAEIVFVEAAVAKVENVRSVINELETAEELTKENTTVTLTMCVNYGGRAEIADKFEKLPAGANPFRKGTRT